MQKEKLIALVLVCVAIVQGLESDESNFATADMNVGLAIMVVVIGFFAYTHICFLMFVFIYGLSHIIHENPGCFVVTSAAFLLFYMTTFGVAVMIAYLRIIPYANQILQGEFLHVSATILAYCQYFFVGFVVFQWALAVFAQFAHPPGINRKTLAKLRYGEKQWPFIYCLMPIYNEDFLALKMAVASFTASEYPKDRLRLKLCFDDDSRSELFVAMVNELGFNEDPNSKRVDGVFEGVHITLNRFAHGGKRATQAKAFYQVHEEIGQGKGPKDSIIFFIDSDINLAKFAVRNLAVDMVHNPNRIAVTGLITCRTVGQKNFLWYIQDVEYVYSQSVSRAIESALGSVSCLPGALTMIRYTALLEVKDIYFVERGYKNSFEFMRHYLGEDRFLTHLLMEKYHYSGSLGYCPTARSKTEAPESYMTLLKQRRRWFLGHMGNELWMLCSPALWKTYPMLMFYRFLESTQSGGLIVFFVIAHLFIVNRDLAALMIVFTVGPSWFFTMLQSFRYRRFKLMLFYPVYFFLMPIMYWTFVFHAITSLHKQTWGGPRTNATVAAAPAAQPHEPSAATELSTVSVDKGHSPQKSIESSVTKPAAVAAPPPASNAPRRSSIKMEPMPIK